MKRIPSDYKRIEKTVMSNFDDSIDFEIAERLKSGRICAEYTAWNFFGIVWWDKMSYKCEIWVHKSYRETLSGSLEEIMTKASSKYGND
jgi:hypothetical protein